ncbi:MAG: O-antigen ligase family protein [Microgenomates group bacterium]
MINFLYTSLFFFTPLIFSLVNSEQFEIPKMYFVYFMTLAILTTHLFNYLRGKSPLIKITPLLWPLLIFLFFQTISYIFSIDPHTSFYGYYSRLNGGLLSLFCYTILYLILTIYNDTKLTSQIIRYSLLSGLIIALYGILEHFGIDKNLWNKDVQARVFSTLGQPNWLAAYLCILLPFSLDKFLSSNTRILNTYYLILNTVLYLCLLFTGSKSGLLAAVISLSIQSLLYLSKNKFIPPLRFYFCLFAFVFLSLVIPNPIKDYFQSHFIPNTKYLIPNTNLNITPSEDIRKIVWQGSVKLWHQFPYFGTGPETFAYSYYWTRPASHNLTSEWNFYYNKAHNEYLNYLATTGTFGFLSYLILIFSILYLIRNTIYLIPFLSILITNFFGFSVVVTSLYFFLLPAMIVVPSNFNITKSKNILYFVILVSSFLFLVSKLFMYLLADIAYAHPTPTTLRFALNIRPDEALYHSKYAQLLAENDANTHDKQHLTTIVESLGLATKLSPFNLNLWKERAHTYYYLSTIDSSYYVYALDAITKATKLAPTDASSFYFLGKLYQNISDTDKAIINYQEAIRLKSNYDHATFALGELYYQQKKYDLARPLLDKTLEIAPQNPDAKKYLNLINH